MRKENKQTNEKKKNKQTNEKKKNKQTNGKKKRTNKRTNKDKKKEQQQQQQKQHYTQSMKICKLLLRNVTENHRLMKNNNKMDPESSNPKTTRSKNFIVDHPRISNFLVAVFGISAWIGVNGIYVQLPLLVNTAPEGWNLAANLVLAIQAANLGPIIYTLSRKFFRTNETICIYVLLIIGSASILALAFFNDLTIIIGNHEYSLTLYVCSFFSALVGCTSSVLFMPYLRETTERHLTSYFIGEGLSGLIPSVLALIQGVGENSECSKNSNDTKIEIIREPRFSSKKYFLFIFVILLSCLWAFAMLQHFFSLSKNDDDTMNDDRCDDLTIVDERSSIDDYRNDLTKIRNDREITKIRKYYFYIVLGSVCLLGNGFLPGIQTYSCLPYGNVAFHLTVTMANLANPAACFIYTLMGGIDFWIFDVVTIFATIDCAYVIYLAATPSVPPLVNSVYGATITILAWIIVTGIISYHKIFVTSLVKRKFGSDALFGLGIFMQLGSACGAFISIGLVNHTTIFRRREYCDDL